MVVRNSFIEAIFALVLNGAAIGFRTGVHVIAQRVESDGRRAFGAWMEMARFSTPEAIYREICIFSREGENSLIVIFVKSCLLSWSIKTH